MFKANMILKKIKSQTDYGPKSLSLTTPIVRCREI